MASISSHVAGPSLSSTSTQWPSQLSVVDLFRVGIGPSSSHTVGPMRAGRAFALALAATVKDPSTLSSLRIDLFGSLGATGRGHNTDRAVLLGLAGHDPQTVTSEEVESLLPTIARTGRLPVEGVGPLPFDIATDMRFLPRSVLPYHVNALSISTYRDDGSLVLARTYYSVGGGFVMEETSPDPLSPAPLALDDPNAACDALPFSDQDSTCVPYPFTTGAQLLATCERTGLSVADLVRANECALRPSDELEAHLDLIANTMFECVDTGIRARGILPGGLDVPRRAAALADKLRQRASTYPGQGAREWASTPMDPMRAMDWVNLYALAVNEENAAGHRVVTAPTNGAAGVVPAVLGYLTSYCPEAGAILGIVVPSDQDSTVSFRLSTHDEDGAPARRRRAVHDFLLAATAVGSLIKMNASIAGAEVGCQGEVGSASAMAAAGLAQALGGSAQQVENAAEIAMEHSLGLTCDPVAGLVQIPCIERNAIAAVKAINAARMALWGDGRHAVSLDAVIETMRQTGVDMLSKYKETSAGGLAVNVVEC